MRFELGPILCVLGAISLYCMNDAASLSSSLFQNPRSSIKLKPLSSNRSAKAELFINSNPDRECFRRISALFGSLNSEDNQPETAIEEGSSQGRGTEDFKSDNESNHAESDGVNTRVSSSISDLLFSYSKSNKYMQSASFGSTNSFKQDEEGTLLKRENLKSVEATPWQRPDVMQNAKHKIQNSPRIYEDAPLLPPEAYDDESFWGNNKSTKGQRYGPGLPSPAVIAQAPNSMTYLNNMNAKDRSYEPLDPDEIHRKIMKQETGFIDQSEEFKAALFDGMQNATQSALALEKRRQNLIWKKKETQALEDLQQTMKGFEEIIEQNEIRRRKTYRGGDSSITQKRNGRFQSNASSSPNSRARLPLLSSGRNDGISRSDLPKGVSSSARGNISANSSSAMEFYKREMVRYRDQARNAEKQIQQLKQQVQELQSKLRSKDGQKFAPEISSSHDDAKKQHKKPNNEKNGMEKK